MDETVTIVFKLISKEVGMLQNLFSSAYSNAVADEEGITTVTLDLEELNYVIFALEQYQMVLQEVIIDGQNKEQ